MERHKAENHNVDQKSWAVRSLSSVLFCSGCVCVFVFSNGLLCVWYLLVHLNNVIESKIFIFRIRIASHGISSLYLTKWINCALCAGIYIALWLFAPMNVLVQNFEFRTPNLEIECVAHNCDMRKIKRDIFHVILI